MTLQRVEFELRGDHITLDALLKATGLAPSGGAAKRMVADGRVQVDGRDEARKTCKIRAGQVVSVPGARVRVLAAAGVETVPVPVPVPAPASYDGDDDTAPAGARGAETQATDATLSSVHSNR